MEIIGVKQKQELDLKNNKKAPTISKQKPPEKGGFLIML